MKQTHLNGLPSFSRTLLSIRKLVSLALGLALSATVIASPPSKRNAAGAGSTVAHRWFQIGKATWYGRAFQGKRTATGERFNMNALTCAHPTLPLGSWLRVTNLSNAKSTFVRVNDRGPYAAHAIVDLSFAAAQRLALFGHAQVRVEQVRSDDPELAEAMVTELATNASANQITR